MSIQMMLLGVGSAVAQNYSVDFDGTGDYLSLASTTDLNLTADFTIEFLVYPRSQSTSRQTIIQTGSWGSQYAVVQIQNDTQTGIDKKAQLWDYDMNNGMPIIYSNTDIEEDRWTHVAFTRSSGTIKIWINGILDKTATGLSDSIDLGHTTALIGNHSNNYYLNAKLSNLRIVKGTAVYTAAFIPPSEALTNITNTKLLCCDSNAVTSATATPGTITANGDPQVDDGPFPFDRSGKYSVDFDGTDDYLSVGSSSDWDYGTGDFCIEGWYFADSLTSSGWHKRLFVNGSSNNDNIQIYVDSDGLVSFNIGGSPTIQSANGAMSTNQWTHIAIVRNSSVLSLYVNGVQVSSASNSTDIDQQNNSFYIGSHPSNTTASWNGKISNFRVVKGTAVYTSAFTPSTTPLTNITNTKLLCCNNSSVTGKTVGGTITANGDPQLDNGPF